MAKGTRNLLVGLVWVLVIGIMAVLAWSALSYQAKEESGLNRVGQVLTRNEQVSGYVEADKSRRTVSRKTGNRYTVDVQGQLHSIPGRPWGTLDRFNRSNTEFNLVGQIIELDPLGREVTVQLGEEGSCVASLIQVCGKGKFSDPEELALVAVTYAQDKSPGNGLIPAGWQDFQVGDYVLLVGAQSILQSGSGKIDKLYGVQ